MTASHTTKAWSCTMRLVVEDDRVLGAAAADFDAILTRIDAAASRFRSDSALSIANSRANATTNENVFALLRVSIASEMRSSRAGMPRIFSCA